ncbi:flagellin [Pseudobdellovibrio exovorus]|uniref:Flagellin n=1 Tax=Pseudobdellovibrio exovorus JSS TaxID=1184267 RepID=M4VAP6_9BACT|nr:flagellin [Pseudobdellovibrio exovorus]AGH96303.1 flagellin [Pseudobdellovibrio exovorus JSS]
MGLRVTTNMASIAAQRSLAAQSKKLEHASQALSTGSRIVRAADDSAGLAISENMKSEIRATAQARSNAFNAISATQVGEGGLSEVSNLITRLRELGVQAASDSVGQKERQYLQLEAKSLSDEIDRIAKTTKFGEKMLLDGSNAAFDFHVGSDSGKENIITYRIEGNATSSELNLDSVDITSKSGARDLLSNAEQALEKVSTMRASFGAIQSRLESTVNGLDVKYENMSAARSRIADADIAKESSDLASATMLQSAGLSVLAQANQQPYAVMKLLG